MRVLFLTPWYPSEQDAMSGLFVQKHAEAIRAQGADVRVIHSQTLWDTTQQWLKLREEGWIPDIIQLNVIQKQGLLAEALNIPYIIVEHWSGYLPENGQFSRMSTLKRDAYLHIARNAEMVLTVSEPLQQAMIHCGFVAKRWGTIDNVVDEFFFEKSRKTAAEPLKDKSIKTLLHVSCFDEKAKNVKGLLRAAKVLSERRQDWRLVLVGFGVDWKEVHEFARKLQIPEGLLCWTGEITPEEVAEEMHKADAFVLSSRYETYGVVLAEAASAGLPILSTPVGIAEDVGALIVPQEIAQNKPGTFAEFMENVLFKVESRKIADEPLKVESTFERFSAEAIGKKLMEIYDSCLHRDI